ncbi:hypothetical protein [Streptomyces sp. NPDC029674]|uniref:hypothetical protein n=1 Tax=Streptomyces sp. NPDC029674 TaxID=3365297 RepID=UPI00384D7183
MPTPEERTPEDGTPEELTPEELTPSEAARWAARSGLPLAADRHEAVAATADHIRSVVAVLRELDFADTSPMPPTTTALPATAPLHPTQESHHAAV